MDREALIKAILAIGVKILIQLIPALSGFLGIPIIGWIAGLGISWLTGLLADWVARIARDAGIDDRVNIAKDEASKALVAVKTEILTPSNAENYEAARARFDAAVSRLGRVVLQQPS